MSGSDDDSYEVGYKKPPLHSRFQKGHKRGNQAGRKKGSRNLKSDLQEELAELITLQEGGRKIRISKQRALVKALTVKGIKGDDRAAGKVLDLLLRLFGIDDPGDAETPLAEQDQAILDLYFPRKEG